MAVRLLADWVFVAFRHTQPSASVRPEFFDAFGRQWRFPLNQDGVLAIWAVVAKPLRGFRPRQFAEGTFPSPDCVEWTQPNKSLKTTPVGTVSDFEKVLVGGDHGSGVS